MNNKELHKQSILDALTERDLAEDSASRWRQAINERCVTAYREGVSSIELAGIMGMTPDQLVSLVELVEGRETIGS